MANSHNGVTIENLFEDAETSDHYMAYRPSYSDETFKTITDYCKETIKDLNVVLDIGCGPGKSTIGFCKYFKRVIGLDISASQIERAPKDIPNCEFRVGDAADLSFLGDASVDLFAAGLSLNLMPHQEVLKEADRILRPGGSLAIFGYNPPGSKNEKLNEILQESTRIFKPQLTKENALILTRYEGIDIPYPGVTKKEGISVSRMTSYNGVQSFWPFLQRVLHSGGKDKENTFLKYMTQKMAETFPEYAKRPDEPVFEITYYIFMMLAHKPT